ncbi:hypothetical protein [Trebonia sp.]|uniref:hypothetical protein n=1 Tax=Trebonia sp. TaxID=2767075 RepID=UPI00262C4611|nr:hypothetical protein [Trebonia sp.]
MVLENRAALQATIAFGLRELGTPQWQEAAGSEASVEVADAGTGPAGPWGQNPPRTAYAAANLMMTGVLDNLACLHQILDDAMPVIGPTIVARSAIEIASTVWWLMEPRIGVRRRVCRELVISLTSARRAGQVASGMQASGYQTGGLQAGSAVGNALQQEGRVLQRIADLGISSPTGRRYEPVIEGEQASNATDATGAMLRAVVPANAPPDFVYRTYSAITHGEVYGLMNFMASGVSSSGTPLLHWYLPPDVLDSTVQVTITAFQQTYQRIRKVMGWGFLAGDLWEAKVRRIYRTGRP